MATKKIQILGTDLLNHLGTVVSGEIRHITLSADAWEGDGEGELYKQKIDLDNIPDNCKVDITFDLDRINRESDLSGCIFCVKNDHGDLWVYCNAYSIYEETSDINAQLYITTVTTTTPDPIWGSTCMLI